MKRLWLGAALALAVLAGCTVNAGDTSFTVLGTTTDCANCPPMIVFGPGHFRFGMEVDDFSPPLQLEAKLQRSSPRVWVDIVAPYAMAVDLVTRGQFREFIQSSGYQPAHNCEGGYSMNWTYSATGTKEATLAAMAAKGIVLNPPPGEMDWDHNDLGQDDTHPVTCISRQDALAYIAWFNVNRKPPELPPYRLPAPIEFKYGAGGGGVHRYTWGDDWHQACLHANIGDLRKGAALPDAYDPPVDCDDGWTFTSPVDAFPPNVAGLRDVNGNLSNMLGGFFMWGNDPPPEHHNLPGYNRCLSMAPICDVTRVPAAGGAWYKSDMKFVLEHYSGNALVKNGVVPALPFNGFRMARDCRSAELC